MSVPRLAFNGPAPSLRRGLNATVRVGAKWLQEWLNADEKPFDVVLLGDDGQPIGDAVVEEVYYCRLAKLPGIWVRMGRMPEGWLIEMVKSYLKAKTKSRVHEVSLDDYVSVVFFRVKPNQE